MILKYGDVWSKCGPNEVQIFYFFCILSTIKSCCAILSTIKNSIDPSFSIPIPTHEQLKRDFRHNGDKLLDPVEPGPWGLKRVIDVQELNRKLTAPALYSSNQTTRKWHQEHPKVTAFAQTTALSSLRADFWGSKLKHYNLLYSKFFVLWGHHLVPSSTLAQSLGAVWFSKTWGYCPILSHPQLCTFSKRFKKKKIL